MKSFKEYLEEISKKTYVSAIDKKRTRTAADAPVSYRRKSVHSGDFDDPSNILKRAEREHGKKFASQVKNVGKSSSGRRHVTQTPDPLESRKPSRVTKAGKAKQSDVKDLKKTMKGQHPSKPSLKGKFKYT